MRGYVVGCVIALAVGSFVACASLVGLGGDYHAVEGDTSDANHADSRSSDAGADELQAEAGPLLTGQLLYSPPGFNLTQEGSLDWIHLGGPNQANNAYPGLDRKVTGNVIQFDAVDGSQPGAGYSGVYTVRWGDGTPDQSTVGDSALVFVSDVGSGFTLTVPADGSLRTLAIYGGGYRADGTITAHLESGSVPDFTQQTHYTFGGGEYEWLFTLQYRAASTDTLTITYVETACWVDAGETDSGCSTIGAIELVAAWLTGDRD